jgi:segregation and condensation protein A
MTDVESHNFELRMEIFDGPIDLLLHLVKINELSIEKLALAEVASQYLEYLERMRCFDLEVAGEYLVIAATLVSIKSSIILNDPVELVIDDEGKMVNPHDVLLERLREAAIYREGADKLADCRLLGVDVFDAPQSMNRVDGLTVTYRPHDAMLLGEAFRKVLKKIKDTPQYSVFLESVSVVDRMMAILDLLKLEPGGVEFSRLVPDTSSRGAVIGSFVALLELCKRHVIFVKQDQIFQSIVVVLSSDNFDPQKFYSQGGLVSEFDQKEVFDTDSSGNEDAVANA